MPWMQISEFYEAFSDISGSHQPLKISILFTSRTRPPTDRPKMVCLQLYMLCDWGASDLKKGILWILSTYSDYYSPSGNKKLLQKVFILKFLVYILFTVIGVLGLYIDVYSPELFHFWKCFDLRTKTSNKLPNRGANLESHDMRHVFISV